MIAAMRMIGLSNLALPVGSESQDSQFNGDCYPKGTYPAYGLGIRWSMEDVPDCPILRGPDKKPQSRGKFPGVIRFVDVIEVRGCVVY